MPEIFRRFHFILSFYSDEARTRLVGTLSSVDYWQHFRVNGKSITQDGIEVEDFDCVLVDFSTPPDAPGFLFNRFLYIEVEPIAASTAKGLVTTDVVVIVDESGSMSAEQAWVPNMVTAINESLVEQGIGPNRFALVGFGGDPELNNLDPHKHTIGTGDFMTAEDFQDAATQLTADRRGGIEDGYLAIDYALNNYDFREQAILTVILVTDEDRDIIDSDITYTSIRDQLQGACGGNGSLTAVIGASLVAGDGTPALGVDADGNAFIADGADFTVKEGGQYAGTSVAFGNSTTKRDYYDLAIELNGAVFDLSVLKDDGPEVEAFTKALAELKVAQVEAAYVSVNPIDPIAFYCFKSFDQPDVPTIEFTPTFENDGQEPGESGDVPIDAYTGNPVGTCLHFRASYYADEDYQSLVHSSFSLLDQRRWVTRHAGEDDYVPITASGVLVEFDTNISAIYTPEMTPSSRSEQQREFSAAPNQSETPLLCGVTYYLRYEVFINNEFEIFDEITYRVGCQSVVNSDWGNVEDRKYWLSSGQGKTDMLVSKSSYHSMYPRVAFNRDSIAMIAWQDLKTSDRATGRLDYSSSIFYGLYEASADTFWSSGQGLVDRQALPSGFRPKLTTDGADNFYLGSSELRNIGVWNCRLPGQMVFESTAEPAAAGGACQLTDEALLNVDDSARDARQYLKCRVFAEDAKGSYVVDSENTISEVDEYIVRLECSGLPNAYAVRLRNEDDSDWSEWINIDEEIRSEASRLPEVAEETSTPPTEGEPAPLPAFSTNEIFSGYSIDHDRFVVPWVLSCGIGIKHVSVQVLTIHGISPSFSCSILANVPEFSYEVEFSLGGNAVPSYRGLPVVAESSDENQVGVKVSFQDKDRLEFYLTHLARWTKLGNLSKSLTFDVIQQGLNDQTNLILSETESGAYEGVFSIPKSDGVFNKDGLAAIVVNLPTVCNAEVEAASGGSDDIDIFNRANVSMIDKLSSSDSESQDIDPDGILQAIARDGVTLIDDKQRMRQTYSKDDPRFTFGNPKFFISKQV